VLFAFSLLWLIASTCLEHIFAHHQEAIYIKQLVYFVYILSAGTQPTKYVQNNTSGWSNYTDILRCTVNKTLSLSHNVLGRNTVQFGANPQNHTTPYPSSFNDKYISITNRKTSLVIAALLNITTVYLSFMPLNILMYVYSVLRQVIKFVEITVIARFFFFVVIMYSVGIISILLYSAYNGGEQIFS
jgi:hypothetical protein